MGKLRTACSSASLPGMGKPRSGMENCELLAAALRSWEWKTAIENRKLRSRIENYDRE
ncbi:MAG: hypothetical protein QNJ38_23690 [Prochloraceae cyanobacterium]|nr:hypothetical protein [Prochloraceae cyanobacterium]